jgi:hypothetical protein
MKTYSINTITDEITGGIHLVPKDREFPTGLKVILVGQCGRKYRLARINVSPNAISIEKANIKGTMEAWEKDPKTSLGVLGEVTLPDGRKITGDTLYKGPRELSEAEGWYQEKTIGSFLQL